MNILEDITSALFGEMKAEIRELWLWPMTARLGEPLRYRMVIFPKENVELTNIMIRLICFERGVHGHGKNRYIKTYGIYEDRRDLGPGILTAAQPMNLEGEFIIPRTLPSSFIGRYNSIVWNVEARLMISNWPDVVKNIEIKVIPYQYPYNQTIPENAQTQNIVPAK